MLMDEFKYLPIWLLEEPTVGVVERSPVSSFPSRLEPTLPPHISNRHTKMSHENVHEEMFVVRVILTNYKDCSSCDSP